MEFDLKKTLEALLLSTAEPISLKDLGKVFKRYHLEMVEAAETEKDAIEGVPSLVTQAMIRDAMVQLMDAAEVEDKAYRLIEGPNGYQIVSAPQFAEFVRLLRGAPRPMKLSSAALETLSIIAYRQPVTRAEMEAIRGVSVDGPLHRLLRWSWCMSLAARNCRGDRCNTVPRRSFWNLPASRSSASCLPRMY